MGMDRLRRVGVMVAVVVSFAAVVWAQRGRDSAADPAGSPAFSRWSFGSAQVKGKTVPDLAGKLDASLQGAPASISAPADAIELRNEDDFVLVRNNVAPEADFLPRQNFTVAGWVRLDEGTRYGGICGIIQDNGSFERGWLLGYDESSFTFALAATADRPKLTYLKGKTNYVAGKWYHVAATYDGKSMRLFVNGSEDAVSTTQSGAIAYAPRAPFVIGRYRDADEDYAMRGAIREVAIWHAALSPEVLLKQFTADKAIADLPPTGGGNRFVIRPYLQSPTQTSMTIMWETSKPGTSVVEYGPTPTQLKRTEQKKDATIHEVVLNELEPEGRYVYRVSTTIADGSTLTSPFYQFQTAVKEGSAFSFAVIGDTQKNPKVTAKIARLMYERRPHFTMHLGDVVDSGPDKSEWVHELFGPAAELFARSACMPTIGNHERNHPWYYKYFSLPAPEYHYQYRYGNADFFSLDTNKRVGPGTDQFRWLDEQLAKSTAKWKFVYHHHPVWSSDSDDYGDTSKNISRYGDANARALAALYEKHKVDIVFNGHIHLYERTWPLRDGKVDRKNGVMYITSGGGGGKLEDFGPLPTWFKAQLRVDFHCCYINIHEGQLEFKAFDQNGQLFDTFELNK